MSDKADVWRDLVERAHHLAVCVFKGSTKADYERARHNAAVLANAIDRARQNERNTAALDAGHTGVDQARETARKIVDSGEALSATNAEIRELAQAYLDAGHTAPAASSDEWTAGFKIGIRMGRAHAAVAKHQPAIKLIEQLRDEYIGEHCQSYPDGHYVSPPAQSEYIGYLDDIIQLLRTDAKANP